MCILFGFAGGTGHFNPLVPIARAAAAAGHVVAFTSRPRMVPTVEAAGFTVLAVGVDSGSVPARIPLRPLDMAREERDFRENFAGWIARQRVARASLSAMTAATTSRVNRGTANPCQV
jgi:UDP:flavonoid glycosyltransferase YjiC (YdhE family)